MAIQLTETLKEKVKRGNYLTGTFWRDVIDTAFNSYNLDENAQVLSTHYISTLQLTLNYSFLTAQERLNRQINEKGLFESLSYYLFEAIDRELLGLEIGRTAEEFFAADGFMNANPTYNQSGGVRFLYDNALSDFYFPVSLYYDSRQKFFCFRVNPLFSAPFDSGHAVLPKQTALRQGVGGTLAFRVGAHSTAALSLHDYFSTAQYESEIPWFDVTNSGYPHANKSRGLFQHNVSITDSVRHILRGMYYRLHYVRPNQVGIYDDNPNHVHRLTNNQARGYDDITLDNPGHTKTFEMAQTCYFEHMYPDIKEIYINESTFVLDRVASKVLDLVSILSNSGADVLTTATDWRYSFWRCVWL